MDLEYLAREMRERALLLENNPQLATEKAGSKKLKAAKQEQIRKLEELKKLYFNAGRWAGGARDHIAREAFLKVNNAK